MAGQAAAPFPLMYHYTAPLRAAAGEAHQFSLYGQSAALVRGGDAAGRFNRLVEEAAAAMAGPR